MIKSEAICKGTNKDYLPTSAASAGKEFVGPNKLPSSNFLNNIKRPKNRNLLDAKNLFIYAACYKIS